MRKSSIKSQSSERWAKENSGSIIQNSAAWRVVLLFFGAEGRPEGIDLAVGEGEGFDVELSGDGEMDIVLVEVFRRFLDIGIDLEGLAFAFAVVGGKNRGMDPIEAVLEEILMDVVGQSRADAEDSVEGIGLHAPLRNRPKVFKGGLLFLERKVLAHPADKFDPFGLELERLLGLRREMDLALDLTEQPRRRASIFLSLAS